MKTPEHEEVSDDVILEKGNTCSIFVHLKEHKLPQKEMGLFWGVLLFNFTSRFTVGSDDVNSILEKTR